MSIADHFEQAPDSSFVRDYSGSTARRQWNMSLVLVGMMMVASVAIGLVLRFDESGGIADQPGQAVAQAAPPAYVGKL